MFRNIPCFSEYILDIDVKDDEYILDIDVKDDEYILDIDVKDDFLILFKDCIKSLIFKTGHYYPKELFNYFLKNNYDNILKLNGNNYIDSCLMEIIILILS